MNTFSQKEGISVFVEGGTLPETQAMTTLIAGALANRGFTNTRNCNTITGELRNTTPGAAHLTVPSVMQYMREQHPRLFEKPVIVSAYAHEPFQGDRRQHDRLTLHALDVARSSSYVDPDDAWRLLDDTEKERLLLLHNAGRVEYSF